MKNMFLAIAGLLLAVSCNTKAKNAKTAEKELPSELLGSFQDDYGIAYHICKTTWQQGDAIKYHLLFYNREGNYFIAQNDSANPTDGNLYSRIDIVYFTGMEPWRWGFCLTEYKAATMQAAMNAAAANSANPRKGCNGFPFSRMKKK